MAHVGICPSLPPDPGGLLLALLSVLLLLLLLSAQGFHQVAHDQEPREQSQLHSHPGGELAGLCSGRAGRGARGRLVSLGGGRRFPGAAGPSCGQSEAKGRAGGSAGPRLWRGGWHGGAGERGRLDSAGPLGRLHGQVGLAGRGAQACRSAPGEKPMGGASGSASSASASAWPAAAASSPAAASPAPRAAGRSSRAGAGERASRREPVRKVAPGAGL